MAAETATATILKSMETMGKRIAKEMEERAKEIEERVDAVEEEVVQQLVVTNAFAAQTRHIQEVFFSLNFGENIDRVSVSSFQ